MGGDATAPIDVRPGDRLFRGSGRLLVAQPRGSDRPGLLSPWAALVRDGRFAWIGPPGEAPACEDQVALGEALVTPGLIDAHTHPVFVGDRSDEAAARLAGGEYGSGGILRTVAATRAADDASLRAAVEGRLHHALANGTTTLEAKSGYGLSAAQELRALRLLREVAARLPIRLIRTFLGAHAVPPEAASADAYVATVVDEMLPAVAGEAEFCDVFADRGFFDLDATETILNAARRHGLGLRLHAEQLARTGAAELGVRLAAASVDHLEQLDAAGVAVLAGSATVATLLPGPALVLRGPLPPARALLEAGATVALATDFNAGTYGSLSMPLVIGLAATLLGMTVEEAVTAATAGGAAALGLANVAGMIRPGLAADLVAWDAEQEGAFALHLGEVAPLAVFIAGEPIQIGEVD